MKTLQVKTAQNVIINFTLANAGQRLGAFIIDNIIKFAYLYFAFKVLHFRVINDAFDDGWTIRAMDILIFLPVTFYSLYSEILLKGQTIGKRLLQIKIINIDGFKPTTIDFIMRWFLRIVDFNIFMLLFVYMVSLGINNNLPLLWIVFLFGKSVGLLLILLTRKNQRFGDVIANTVVIYQKDQVKFSDTILEDITINYVPMYPNVIKLSDNDARIIKETFANATKANDFKTLIKLRTKILEVTGIISKHNSDKEFINVVLKDYNFYTQNM